MMKNKSKKPAWTPEDAGKAFAGKVVRGITESGENTSAKTKIKRKKLAVTDYVKGIREGNRAIMGRAISLVESNAAAHTIMAQEVLQKLLPNSGKSIRIGITGLPGAGKSTFIEAFGMMLIDKGHRVAVLAVDPSSSVTGGSILGDKTRMETLSHHPQAFIRPSPSRGKLGGVAGKTRETMLICEAAGFDVILVETVGVGQSEITVRSMVDFFLLMQITGGGDELQGIKKGVVEIADAIIINKADGENEQRAKAARREMQSALRYVSPITDGWKTRAFTCSALNGNGLREIWQMIERFQKVTTENGMFALRRQLQAKAWMHHLIMEKLAAAFHNHPEVKNRLKEIELAVVSGKMHVSTGAKALFSMFKNKGD